MSVAPHLGDHAIVSLLQPLAKDEHFRHWPLHVTLIPWFRTHMHIDDLRLLVASKIADIHGFTATMGEHAQFGFKDQVPVRIVQSPNQFEILHQRILQAFAKHPDIHILDTAHIGAHFRAHVTLHTEEPLREGDIISCNDLQIVRLTAIHPGGSTKEVEGEIDLG